VTDVLTHSEPTPGVHLLTLSQPDLRNAMTEELTGAWSQAVAALAADATLRALVVTGAGSAFCAGGDLSWIEAGASGEEATPDALRTRMLPFYRTWLAVRDLPVPVVAAVNGPAIGAGLCLALACDLRYASPTARFSAPFTQLGMHAGMAATWLLPEAVGVVRARELLYTGRVLQPDEALAWGLVNGVSDDVVAHALEVADRIAAAAPIATRLTKAGLAQAAGVEQVLQWEALAQPVTMATADFREGLAARARREKPTFTGR
jgi:enoyl-CoA hydratase